MEHEKNYHNRILALYTDDDPTWAELLKERYSMNTLYPLLERLLALDKLEIIILAGYSLVKITSALLEEATKMYALSASLISQIKPDTWFIELSSQRTSIRLIPPLRDFYKEMKENGQFGL